MFELRWLHFVEVDLLIYSMTSRTVEKHGGLRAEFVFRSSIPALRFTKSRRAVACMWDLWHTQHTLKIQLFFLRGTGMA